MADTLVSLDGEVVSIAGSAGALATEAKQDVMITALQLIDDLRTALASVGGDELRTALLTIAGVAPQFDDTDKLAVSLYGKGAAAGDTEVLVDAARGIYVTPYGSGFTLSDGTGNVTRAVVDHAGNNFFPGAFPHLFNGATWDRARCDPTGVARVSLYGKNAVAGDMPLNVSAAGNQEVDILVAGQAPQMDDTDKMAVSLYGEAAAAGDVALECSPVGRVFASLGTRAAGTDGVADVQLFVIDDTDGTSNQLATAPFLYNGLTWDRPRNNEEATLLASSARTATATSGDQVSYNARRLMIFVNVTSITDTPSVTPSIQVKDSISSSWAYVWTAAAAITATGQYVYYFGDGASGGSWTEILPFGIPARTWRLVMAHGDADSITYSVSAVFLV